jgi:glyoxylase-like metal-dependent hydrolase (beta-lactamase superfamily II)
MFETLDYGIHCIDTFYQRPGLAACYLLVDGDEAALIDTGTAPNLPNLQQVLDQVKIGHDQVRYIIATHVHLDHAGAAGQLIEMMPHAQLVVHPQGARHMIDPAKLQAGATAVYGEEKFKADFDRLLPIPAERVIEATDRLTLDLGKRRLAIHDTPGHARHHIAIHDSASNGLFTGDTFGICYPELAGPDGPFIFPPATPVQFDPQAWHATVDQLAALAPSALYLTHYGKVDWQQRLADNMHRGIDDFAAIGRAVLDAADRTAAIRNALIDWFGAALSREGSPMAESDWQRHLVLDLDLNTQGIQVWVERELVHQGAR